MATRPKGIGSPAFPCPTCGIGMNVLDTRPRADGYLYRRRACPVCGFRLTTAELPTDHLPPADPLAAILPRLFAIADLINPLRSPE